MRVLCTFTITLTVIIVASCYGMFEDREACDGVTCSGHGECLVDADDNARCLCEDGYTADGLECRLGGADGDVDVDVDADSDGDGDGDMESVAWSWQQDQLGEDQTGFVERDDGILFTEGNAELLFAWSDFGANLLANPGAETGDISGWVDVDDFRVDTSERHGGAYAFGEAEGSAFEGRQHVDLSPYESLIDVGQARISFEAWCYTRDGDEGRVYFDLLSEGQSPGRGEALWREDSGNMDHDHFWGAATVTADILPGARSAGVYLVGRHLTGDASSVWFDDMSIRLSTEAYAPEGSFVFEHVTTHTIDWGELTWVSTAPVGTAVEVRARTSATELHDWREWSTLPGPGDISSLPGVEDGDGGIQIMFVLSGIGMDTPTVESFSIEGSRRR